MKYQLRAALAAAVLLILPGALLAGTKGKIMAYEYDSSGSIVTGLSPDWAIKKLKHKTFTIHQFIDNPDLLPPGRCRAIANKWNHSILHGRSEKHFTKLIAKSAKRNCNLAFDQSDTPNPDNSFDLETVRPTN